MFTYYPQTLNEAPVGLKKVVRSPKIKALGVPDTKLMDTPPQPHVGMRPLNAAYVLSKHLQICVNIFVCFLHSGSILVFSWPMVSVHLSPYLCSKKGTRELFLRELSNPSYGNSARLLLNRFSLGVSLRACTYAPLASCFSAKLWQRRCSFAFLCLL